jgi:hypothetical protein
MPGKRSRRRYFPPCIKAVLAYRLAFLASASPQARILRDDDIIWLDTVYQSEVRAVPPLETMITRASCLLYSCEVSQISTASTRTVSTFLRDIPRPGNPSASISTRMHTILQARVFPAILQHFICVLYNRA